MIWSPLLVLISSIISRGGVSWDRGLLLLWWWWVSITRGPLNAPVRLSRLWQRRSIAFNTPNCSFSHTVQTNTAVTQCPTKSTKLGSFAVKWLQPLAFLCPFNGLMEMTLLHCSIWPISDPMGNNNHYIHHNYSFIVQQSCIYPKGQSLN